MSLSARLYIGDNASANYTKEYQVAQCKVKVSRHHNTFLPDADPRCDEVVLSVIAPDKNDLDLYEWYIDQTNQSAMYDVSERSYTIEDATCFSIAEMYDIDGPHRHLLRLGIMMKELEIDEVVFQ